MKDIKVKKSKIGTIKTFDKNIIKVQKLKNNIASLKNKNVYQDNYNTENEYAMNKVSTNIKRTPYNIYNSNKIGINKIKETKANFYRIRGKIGKYRNKKTFQKVGVTARNTVNTVKLGMKATVGALKAVIAGTKALISLIMAGGWVAILVIILICLIGLFCSSISGIFFSSEKFNNNITMNEVVADLNMQMLNQINNIRQNNPHDEYILNVDRAEWKEVLSIYTLKIHNTGENIVTLNDEKIAVLEDVFWNMNIITHNVIEMSDKRILYININNKSIEDMIEQYNFDKLQEKNIKELLISEYDTLWKNVIYGFPSGNVNIVNVALAELGNIGGETYWKWYGYTERVDWCACFVSWCAEQCKFIEKNIIPKFSNCQEGVNWFKVCGKWQDNNYIPKER